MCIRNKLLNYCFAKILEKKISHLEKNVVSLSSLRPQLYSKIHLLKFRIFFFFFGETMINILGIVSLNNIDYFACSSKDISVPKYKKNVRVF